MKKWQNTALYYTTILLSALFIVIGWLLFREEANMFRNDAPMDTALCRVTEIISD